MTHDDYELDVAAVNGRPQRLATINRLDGAVFRDHVNADSARSRQGFIRRAAFKFEVEPQRLAWLDDALVTAADDADFRADEAAADAMPDARKNQATALIELCGGVELFRDPEGKGFVRFQVGEHSEVAALRSRHYRNWLAHQFYLTANKAPSAQGMQDAIGVLEGKAIFEGQTYPVHVRVAGCEGKIYVDLCNESWQVVEISTSDWRILETSPVMFRRAKAMLPLPPPVAGGSVDELRPFVQMTDEDWILFKAWLVAAFRDVGPYPVLDVQGEHGSGKSTVCRLARALIDPNTALLRCEPRDPRDIMIAANNGRIVALDNLSGIQAWQSDCLCRLATGGGFSTRMLYENDEEAIFDAQRPVIINGIDDVATRARLPKSPPEFRLRPPLVRLDAGKIQEQTSIEKIGRLSAWPTSPRTLGSAVKRLAPNLRSAGVSVEFTRSGRKGARTIHLGAKQEPVGNSSSATSALSVVDESAVFGGFAADAIADADWPADTDGVEPLSAAEDEIPEDFGGADVADDADAIIRVRSGSAPNNIQVGSRRRQPYLYE